MKSIPILLMLFFNTVHTTAQKQICYSVTLKNADICNSTREWKLIELTGSKEKLTTFLVNNKWIHSCNTVFTPREEVLKDAKEAPCSNDSIRIRFIDPADFIEFHKQVKEAGSPITTEICVNSDGEISFSISNEFGSISVNSKGKFSVSVKGPDGTEYKTEL